MNGAFRNVMAEQDEDSNHGPMISEIRTCHEEGYQESTRLQNLRKQAAQDHVYQQLREIILKGFPRNAAGFMQTILASPASPDSGYLIVYGCRLLIPSGMHREILSSFMQLISWVQFAQSNGQASPYTGQV